MHAFGTEQHGAWRSELAAAGADARVQRAIAWWAGPPSFCGVFAIISSLATIVDL